MGGQGTQAAPAGLTGASARGCFGTSASSTMKNFHERVRAYLDF